MINVLTIIFAVHIAVHVAVHIGLQHERIYKQVNKTKQLIVIGAANAC